MEAPIQSGTARVPHTQGHAGRIVLLVTALALLGAAIFAQFQPSLSIGPPPMLLTTMASILVVGGYAYVASRFRWPVPVLLFLLITAPLWLWRPSAAQVLLWQTLWPFTLSFVSFVRTRFVRRTVDAAALTCAAAGSWLLCLALLLLFLDSIGGIEYALEIAVVPAIAGLGLLIAAVRRQRALALWLGRVRANQLRRWRIEPGVPTRFVGDGRWLFVPLEARSEKQPEALVHFASPEDPGQPIARLARGEQLGWWSSLLLASSAGLLRIALPTFIGLVIAIVGAAMSDGYRFQNRATGQDQPQ